MFRTDLPSIIRSLNTVYTATGICHAEILMVDKITSVYTFLYWDVFLSGIDEFDIQRSVLRDIFL
jgi:hypothetical protein